MKSETEVCRNIELTNTSHEIYQDIFVVDAIIRT